MRKIKLLAIALVLALAGFVSALGQAQDAKNACSMDKSGCCAECCKTKDSCCKTDSKQAHQANGTCASCECCKGEDACCTVDKDGKMQMKEGACHMTKDGKSCCGRESCGASCCTKEKGKAS